MIRDPGDAGKIVTGDDHGHFRCTICACPTQLVHLGGIDRMKRTSVRHRTAAAVPSRWRGRGRRVSSSRRTIRWDSNRRIRQAPRVRECTAPFSEWSPSAAEHAQCGGGPTFSTVWGTGSASETVRRNVAVHAGTGVRAGRTGLARRTEYARPSDEADDVRSSVDLPLIRREKCGVILPRAGQR